MNDYLAPRTRHRLGVVLLGLLLLTASAVTVSAAGSTDVSLDEAETSTAVGGTTTVDVVVGNADGGVGAYNVTVAVDDPDVASIADVELGGDPGLDAVDVSDDGSSVTVQAALMDTNDTGPVTIATVTIAGENAGESDISLTVSTLGDEDGRAYSVTETRGSFVQVTDAADDDPDDSDSTIGDSGADSNDADSDDDSDDTGSNDTGSDDADPNDDRESTDTADASNTDRSTDRSASADATGEDPGPTIADRTTDRLAGLSAPLTVVLFAGVVVSAGFLLTRRVR